MDAAPSATAVPTTTRLPAPGGPLGFMVDPALDAQRRRDLRRMRLVATGLLVFAAIVYVLTRGHDDGVLGFVNAGAEASMVGACADWFAVTAIFRHPLGLPIPHTALIPRKKEMIGKSLEEFVSENFMREDIIRERVLDAEPTRRAAEWVLGPGHAKRLVDEVATVTVHALHRIPDADVRAVIEQAVLPRLKQEPISSLAGGLLDQVVRDEAHVALVDLADDLQHDPVTQAKAERLKERLLSHPQVPDTAMSLWSSLRSVVVAALEDEEGPVRTRAVKEVTGLAERLLADKSVRDRVDARICDATVYAVERYGAEVTQVISATIDRWDGKETAERVELQVGRDLQFIRINGTLVGGLIGVLIHAVSVLIP